MARYLNIFLIALVLLAIISYGEAGLFKKWMLFKKKAFLAKKLALGGLKPHFGPQFYGGGAEFLPLKPLFLKKKMFG